MADYLTTDTELASIANAIRTKGGTSAALEWPSGFAQAIADISSGGVQTAHVEYYPVDQCYYTDATMTVVHQTSAGPVDDDLPIGSLLIDVFDVWTPTVDPTNCTLVAQKASVKNGGYYIYEVTG